MSGLDARDQLRAEVRALCAEWDFEPRCDAWMRGVTPPRAARSTTTPEATVVPQIVGAAAATEVARLAHLLSRCGRHHARPSAAPPHAPPVGVAHANVPAHRAAAQLGAAAARDGEPALWDRLAAP